MKSGCSQGMLTALFRSTVVQCVSRKPFRLQLELRSTGPSTPSVIVDEDGNVIDSRDGRSEPIRFVFEEIRWTSEINQEEASHRLEVTFYPFKKVNVH